MKRDSTTGGFTLVETLVSMALIAMAALLIVQGLGSTGQLWAKVEERTRAGETIESAQSILRERLERGFPATRFDASSPYVDFGGTPDELIWLTIPGREQRPGQLGRFRLRVTTDGELLLGSAPPFANETDLVYAERRILTGVDRFELAYFGPTREDRVPRWRPLWRQEALLPQAIRVRVALREDDSRAWPELIVRPGATIDTQCSLERTTGRCRGRAVDPLDPNK